MGKGCALAAGVCGKKAQTADLQDDLTSALAALASSAEKTEEKTGLIIEGLFTTVTNVNFDDETIRSLTRRVREMTDKPSDFKISAVWNADENTKSLKSLLLFGLKGMAAYAHHARVLGYKNETVDDCFYDSLRLLAGNAGTDELLAGVLKVGEVNLLCMELLDKANTETYGIPVPTAVTTNIEKGPFIVVSGHDLHDLDLLLRQTRDKGINIYTHGEMLPCHAYPELKKYPHLRVTSAPPGKISKKNSRTCRALFCLRRTASCPSKTVMPTACLRRPSLNIRELPTSARTRIFRPLSPKPWNWADIPKNTK